MSTKSTWAAIVGGVAVVGGISYVALLPTAPKKMLITANYTVDKLPETRNWIFEWIHTTNVAVGQWQVYTQIIGTNTLTVSYQQYQQDFFTIGRILDRTWTNVYIILDIYTNQYYKIHKQ